MSPHGRRALQVTLTDEGFRLRLADEAAGAGLTAQTEALSHLGPEQAARPADPLRRLVLGT